MLRPLIGYLFFLFASLFLFGTQGIQLQKKWKVILFGILFQVITVFAFTNLPCCISAIEWVATGVMKLRDATIEGTKFCFGYIGGGDLPFDLKEGGNAFVFAFQVLPTTILVSAISAILTYFRILPVLSHILGYIFKLIFNVKSYIGMVAIAKVFIGQLDTMLLIKDKLSDLKKSEMFTVLALAFATASSSVMPIYSSILEPVCHEAMKHMIISSVVCVISVLLVAVISLPVSGNENNNDDGFKTSSTGMSFMDAVSKGIFDGFNVWWCIVGSLIGTVALLALINYILDIFPDVCGEPITLQRIFGVVTYPFAWLMGIQNSDLMEVSKIIGTRIAVNETVAFFDLAKATISSDSVIRTIYAINNFGNFAAIGITIAGFKTIAPENKMISQIIWKAFIGGLVATGLTSTLIGLFL